MKLLPIPFVILGVMACSLAQTLPATQPATAPAGFVATLEKSSATVTSAGSGKIFQTVAVKFLNKSDHAIIINGCLLNGERATDLAIRVETPDMFSQRPQQFPMKVAPTEGAYFMVLGGRIEYTTPVHFIDLDTDAGMIRCNVQ